MPIDQETLWRDPANWTMWGYNCKSDPRVIVPKRNPAMGWTMNWAHSSAVPMIFVLMVVAAFPTVFVVLLGLANIIGPMTSVLLSLVSVPLTIYLVVAFCKRMARTA